MNDAAVFVLLKKEGDWINGHMLHLPKSPSIEDMEYGTNIVAAEDLPKPPRTTWMGYRNAQGPAGTRNLLGIVTTVQCAAGVLKAAVEKIKKELLVKYKNVEEVRDGVHLLAARCKDEQTRDRLAEEMCWYDKYLEDGGVDRDANPTPGNKKGGLANIVENIMICVSLIRHQ